jgi:hypothetical protein
MNDGLDSLPDSFVREWSGDATRMTFFDRNVRHMRREELLATIGFFADRYKHDPFPVAVVMRPMQPEGFTYTVIGGNL